MFALVGVSKSYGTRPALHPTDLSISPGRTTVILGPSGSGKSTLLRLLVGLARPDAGLVVFHSRRLTSANLRELRHRMGYVIQEGGLFPHLTAAGNVTLLARHLGWPRQRIRERLLDLSAMARLPTDALDQYPIELSGGQRQRVSLMRALMLDPDALLLDEPLGAGGYGQPILTGIRLDNVSLILEGAVPAALLALLAQALFELVGFLFLPRGLRLKGEGPAAG